MIDEYLRELRPRLSGSWWHRRRVAAEVGEHLRDAAAALEAGGVPRDEAESRAIERFGSAESTARLLRQPWHRRRSVHALGMALVVAVAVLAVTRAATHHPRAVGVARPLGVQWISQTAPVANVGAYVRQGPMNAPPCTAAQLRHGKAGMQGALSEMIGAATVINTGPGACTLRGVPTVRLVDATGAVVTPPQFDELKLPSSLTVWRGYPRVSLLPGQHAFADLRWENNCTRPPATTVALTMGSTTFTESLNGSGVVSPPCLGVNATALYSVGVWHPASPRYTPRPNPLPLRVTIRSPRFARRGQILAYRVTLTNYSKSTVVIHACPKYWQGLASSAPAMKRVRRGLVLNCAAHRVMPAKSSVTYNMRMPIPANARRPEDALEWALQPMGAAGKTTILLR